MAVTVMPVVDAGEWLVAHHREMERGEATWLLELARFEAEGLWSLDGQLTCVEWLTLRTTMGRTTAFEKVRIARELLRRPIIAQAFADGRVSYSAVRAITRMRGPDPEVDATLVELAEAGSVDDVERAVRCYRLHADQHQPPAEDDRRGVRIARGYDGTTRIEITVSDVEGEELAAALQAFLDHPTTGDRGGQSPAGYSNRDDHHDDDHREPDDSDAGDGAGGADGEGGQSPAGNSRSGPGRRADAFMDLVATALAHAGDGAAAGNDRYMVHVVTRPDGEAELSDGTPLDDATAACLACDASTVTHLHGEDGEPLSLGRKTKVWSTAQRRAALVRDGGHCRFPGCGRRIVDLHHQWPWEAGGPTDLANGHMACRRHHRLLHRGFRVTGDPNATLTFYRSDGTIIGTTAPTRRRPLFSKRRWRP